MTNKVQQPINVKSIDGDLGFEPWDGRMEGTDESTELNFSCLRLLMHEFEPSSLVSEVTAKPTVPQQTANICTGSLAIKLQSIVVCTFRVNVYL